jgi:hypothetical protein
VRNTVQYITLQARHVFIYSFYFYEKKLNVQVRYLEHVQCRISLKYFPRGQLHILLRFAHHRSYVKVVYCVIIILPCASVADPDPSDTYVFEPPGSGSGSISQRYGSGSSSKMVIPTVL